MSTASAPISIASAISPIRSPACVPTMPPPTMRCVASSNSSLVKPSSRPLAIARPEAAHGNRPFCTLMPLRLGLVLGEADPGDSRDRCRRPTGSRARRSSDFWPRRATSAATWPSCTALCASIGWPTMSPIAKMCGTLVRIWMSTGMKPRSVTATPALSAPIFLPFGAAADGLQHQVVELRSLRRLLAFERDVDAVRASPRRATVFVFSMMLSKRGAFIFCQTLTRSRSAPCIRPSSISTTSRRAPSVE